MLTGRIKSIDPATNTMIVHADQTRQDVRCEWPTFGGDAANIQYGPSLDDLVYMDNLYAIQGILTTVGRPTYDFAGRPDPLNPGKYIPLLEGEWVLATKWGQIIHLDTQGNIGLTVGIGGKITLGTDLTGTLSSPTLKAVARDGDIVTVSGEDSHGDIINLTGHIKASSTIVEAM